jgi:hypothetical protein
MGRLFTFGCSFTSYIWPTWADFVALNFDTHQNWANAGAGNYFISSRLYECNSVNKLTKDDTVLVMFSQYFRNDMIDKNSNWINAGNLYNQTLYGHDFVTKYWTDEHGYFMSWYNILSVKYLLDSIGCKYKFMSAFDISSQKGSLENIPKRMVNCSNELQKILTADNLMDFNEGKPQYNFIDEFDSHPTITTHLHWVKTRLPEYYTESMNAIAEKWESLVEKDKKNTYINFKQLVEKSREFSDFKSL